MFELLFLHYKASKEIVLPRKAVGFCLNEPLNCIAYSRSYDRDGGSDK